MPLVRLSILVFALVATPTASAATTKPCWERVIADWTNGSVQSSYKAACYATALERLPTDVRMYSDADEDIRRAMLAAIRHDDKPPPQSGQTESGQGQSGQTQSGQATSGGEASAAKESAATTTTPARTDGPKSRTLPLPLIFAITLALTLVAAGVVGRLRARRSAQRQAQPLEQ